MGDLSLTIDGKQVQVPSGITVLEAARLIGINIPNLCYDRELTKPGACRLCVVSVEGARNLPASCVTEVREGMVVNTKAPDVIEARKTILELLLANHPQDCMTCEKTGDCRLQDYAYDYGVREIPYQGDKTSHELDQSNPFIFRDNNKCILCGKCVRVCEEVVGKNIYGWAHRGFQTSVVPTLGKDLEKTDCIFCGSCVSVCPVGALTEKDMMGKGRRWEMKKVKTTCPYCGTGCTIELNVKDGKIAGVTSTEDGTVNGRALCVKGRFGYNFIEHADRLKSPLIKENGEFREATWEEALKYTADKLSKIKNDHGNDSFAALTSARVTNEDNYVFNKFTRAVMGTNNIDHCARL